MSKNERITAFVESLGLENRTVDPHYAGYFACFNRQAFYEAHDVLEQLWLPVRRTQEGDFYKGLIQLAGAFVHLQKERPGPAAALFGLARNNLQKYPAQYKDLAVSLVLSLIHEWLERLADPKQSHSGPLLRPETYPRMSLLTGP